MIAGRLTGRLTIRGHTQASTKNEKEALWSAGIEINNKTNRQINKWINT